MRQMSFAEAEYENKSHKTRRELFLERMESLVPWAKLERKLAKHYPKGENGRPPYPLRTMLRVHCLQLLYNLSDPALPRVASCLRGCFIHNSPRTPLIA